MEQATLAPPAARTGTQPDLPDAAAGPAAYPVPLPTDGVTRASAPGDGCATDPWRSVDDLTLLESVRPLLADAGVTRVSDLTGLDDLGVPCVSAVRPNARSLAVSAGKGTTLAAATASAVMEALETATAERFCPPLRLASERDLGVRGVALDALPRTPFARTPTTPILWCDGTELGTGETSAVPFEMVHTDWSLTGGYARAAFPRDSNGLASGATVVEARLHALLELVERDAARVYEHAPESWRDRRRARLDPATTPVAHDLARRIGSTGRLVGVWDLTSDVGVPVVMCVVCEATPDPFRPLPAAAGLGCHLDIDRAATRALTEAAQSRLITIAGARDDQTREAYARCFDPAGTERFRQELAADADLLPLGANVPSLDTTGWTPSGRTAGSGTGTATTDVAPGVAPGSRVPAPSDGDAVAAAGYWSEMLAFRIAERTGHWPVAVELTPVGWPVTVTRVVAPGLEGAGAMFGTASLPGDRATSAAPDGAGDSKDDGRNDAAAGTRNDARNDGTGDGRQGAAA